MLLHFISLAHFVLSSSFINTLTCNILGQIRIFKQMYLLYEVSFRSKRLMYLMQGIITKQILNNSYLHFVMKLRYLTINNYLYIIIISIITFYQANSAVIIFSGPIQRRMHRTSGYNIPHFALVGICFQVFLKNDLVQQ